MGGMSCEWVGDHVSGRDNCVSGWSFEWAGMAM